MDKFEPIQCFGWPSFWFQKSKINPWRSVRYSNIWGTHDDKGVPSECKTISNHNSPPKTPLQFFFTHSTAILVIEDTFVLELRHHCLYSGSPPRVRPSVNESRLPWWKHVFNVQRHMYNSTTPGNTHPVSAPSFASLKILVLLDLQTNFHACA